MNVAVIAKFVRNFLCVMPNQYSFICVCVHVCVWGVVRLIFAVLNIT
jgi:hypothetical protein